jgi:YggT family protein
VNQKGTGMNAVFGILDLILDVVFFIMIAHIIMSWLITFQVLNTRQPLVAQLWDGLNRLLQPIYQPIRRFLPDTGALDLAPLVAFIAVIAVRDYILPELYLSLI